MIKEASTLDRWEQSWCSSQPSLSPMCRRAFTVNEERGTLTSDGKANVQDCWKGHEPELSTWILKSTGVGGNQGDNSLVLENGKHSLLKQSIKLLLQYKTQNLISIKLFNQLKSVKGGKARNSFPLKSEFLVSHPTQNQDIRDLLPSSTVVEAQMDTWTHTAMQHTKSCHQATAQVSSQQWNSSFTLGETPSFQKDKMTPTSV